MIDFAKLLKYLKQKYPHLCDVRYYEGISTDDVKKLRTFNFLKRRGYTICALERKSYNSVEVEEKSLRCPKCRHSWTAHFAKERLIMKSNVDVYLASDMVARASLAQHSTRLILISCDGDYAEAIKTALSLNPNVSISVLATPRSKNPKKNTLSTRLRQLESQVPRYKLQDISSIKDYICKEI